MVTTGLVVRHSQRPACASIRGRDGLTERGLRRRAESSKSHIEEKTLMPPGAAHIDKPPSLSGVVCLAERVCAHGQI